MELHKDADLVDSLICSKKQLGHYKPHPDLPEDESAMLYYAGTLAFRTSALSMTPMAPHMCIYIYGILQLACLDSHLSCSWHA